MAKAGQNTVYDPLQLQRRRIVSSARLRGMTLNQIHQLLIDKGVTNTHLGRPWSVSVVSKDLKVLEEQWREEMMAEISSHRARILAEIKETKTAAWRAGKLSLVLKAINQEVDLLGLNELDRMSVEISLANLFKGFPKEVADQLKSILAKKVGDKKLNKAKAIELDRAFG